MLRVRFWARMCIMCTFTVSMKRGKRERGLTTQFLVLMNVSLCGLDKESTLTPFGCECLIRQVCLPGFAAYFMAHTCIFKPPPTRETHTWSLLPGAQLRFFPSLGSRLYSRVSHPILPLARCKDGTNHSSQPLAPTWTSIAKAKMHWWLHKARRFALAFVRL